MMMTLKKLKTLIQNARTPVTSPMEVLTPELMEYLLEKNTNNIPPVKSKIQLYSSLMKNGEWLYNGDSIRVSNTGRLLDGQNRLYAAIDSGHNLKTDLVVGLPDDVFNTIDRGRVRKTSDLVARSVGGGATASEMSVITQAITRVIKHDNAHAQQSNLTSSAKIKNLTSPDKIYLYLEKYPEIFEHYQYVKSTFGSRALLSQATVLYHYHIGCRFDEEYTRIYLNKLFKGTGLRDGETLHYLNQTLIRVKAKSVKWSRAEIDNTLIKVWNSVGRGGLFSIKHGSNIKSRRDESHVTFNQPSMLAVQEMKDSQL